MLTSYSGKSVSPEDVMKVASDWSPGTRPSTLVGALNQMAPTYGVPATFRVRNAPRHFDFGTLHRNCSPKRPIACLIAYGATALHWITVVRVSLHGNVWYNDYGSQTPMSPREFQMRWSLSGLEDLKGYYGLTPNTFITAR